jgi:hypothetical protein
MLTIEQIKTEMAAIAEQFEITQTGKFQALARGDEAGFNRRCDKLAELQAKHFNLSRLLPSTTVEDI